MRATMSAASQQEHVILANLIRDWATRKPDLQVLSFVDIDEHGKFTTDTRSYQQLWENGLRLAAWLREQGVGKGDRFALLMANHPEFVELMVASSILGSVFVPIDPQTPADKLSGLLDTTQCLGVVVSNEARDTLNTAQNGRDQRWVLGLEEGGEGPNVAEITKNRAQLPHISPVYLHPDDPMQLLCTSGVRADPKVVVISYSRFGIGESIAEVLELTAADRLYTGLSLCHANAQVITLGISLRRGLHGVISRRFLKAQLWEITRHFQCSVINLMGGMANAIYAEPPRHNDRDNPVRAILSAGMPAQIWRDFENRFNVRLTEFYGTTEEGLSFNPCGVGPIGSCGKAPESLEMKILSDNGRECAPYEAGEICFRRADGSPPVIRYHQAPEAAEKAVIDGWFRTGDIGHVDVNGWLFFHFRKGAAIRRNGDIVHTAYVEKSLSALECVDDVYVYGIRTPYCRPGEKDLVAAIVARGKVEPAEVFNHCCHTLDRNAVPGFLQVLDNIPKTASEKPREGLLMEAFLSGSSQVYRKVDWDLV